MLRTILKNTNFHMKVSPETRRLLYDADAVKRFKTSVGEGSSNHVYHSASSLLLLQAVGVKLYNNYER